MHQALDHAAGTSAVATLALALILFGCSYLGVGGDSNQTGPPPVVQTEARVAIIDNAFVEADLTVPGTPSGKVTWTVAGNGPHARRAPATRRAAPDVHIAPTTRDHRGPEGP